MIVNETIVFGLEIEHLLSGLGFSLALVLGGGLIVSTVIFSCKFPCTVFGENESLNIMILHFVKCVMHGLVTSPTIFDYVCNVVLTGCTTCLVVDNTGVLTTRPLGF